MYDYFQKQSIIKRQSKLTGYSIGKSHVGTLKFVENSNDVRIYDEEQFIMYAHF